MNKQEILNKHLGPNFIGDSTNESCLAAMDEYALEEMTRLLTNMRFRPIQCYAQKSTNNFMDYKVWMDENPDKEDVKFLDEEKTIEYIPIGRLEKLFDKFDSWSADFFTFNIYRTGTHWFASGHVLLTVEFWQDGKHYVIKRPGARTIPISSIDLNMDYEATILSLAISNAAKKLGNRFGRSLNNRMDNGETSYMYKIADAAPEETPEEKRAKILIEGATTAEELSVYKKTIPKSMMPLFMEKMKTFKK